MRAQASIALILTLLLTSTVTALSSVTLSEGLRYSVSIVGVAMGEGREWLNVTGEITYHIRVEGPKEYATPEPSLNMTYSEGVEGVDNAGFSVSTLKMKLESTKEFEVKDPFTGVLNPVFLTSISDFPAILSSACRAGVGAPESKNVTTIAALTTYEGRDSLEFFVVFEVNYSDGTSTKIMTHSVIDLSTLEPLYLENNLSEVSSNCSIEVSLKAVLENPGSLPTSGVHEFGVVTSKGDAVIVIGGATDATAPNLSGEDAVSLSIEGEGRVAVIVAHTPSSGAPKIIINGGQVEAETFLSGLGTAYTLKFLPIDSGASVEVVFKNAGVALPWTETPPDIGFTTTTMASASGGGVEVGGGAGLIPYIVGGAVAAILGLAIYLILRRE